MRFTSYLLLCIAAACATEDAEHNDTSSAAEALIDSLGNVVPDVGKPNAEPPSALPSRVAALKEMLTAKYDEGTMFDDLGEDGPEEDGTQFLDMGTITYTSKGVVNSKEAMSEGVPTGFPLIRRAVNALAYSKNEGSNLKKYKQLYQDLMENERQWLEFLDHPSNYEHVFEAVKVLDELAHDHYEREEKLLRILGRLYRDEEQKEAFERVQYDMHTTLFKLHLHTTVIDIEKDTPQILKKLVSYEKEQNVPPDYVGHLSRWIEFYRPGMKKRGIKTPRNIKDVPDEVLLEHFNFVKHKMKGGVSFEDAVKEIVSKHGRSPDPNFNVTEFYAELFETDVNSQPVKAALAMGTTRLMKEMFPRMNSDGIQELREYMKAQKDLDDDK